MITEKMLIETIGPFLISRIPITINKIKDKNSWDKIIKHACDTLPITRNYNEEIKSKLYNLFSKEKIEKLSTQLKKSSIYDFKNIIYKFIFNLFISNNFSQDEANLFTNDFIQIILFKLEKENPDDNVKIYLSNWKNENNITNIRLIKDFELIKCYLKDLNKDKYYTIRDIDYKIRISTEKPSLDLGFFELDDIKFKDSFIKQLINNNNLYIIGTSKEETLLRALNELQKLLNNNTIEIKPVLIITSHEEWKKLVDKKITNNYLIPFFYSESIFPIENNTNIFIYNDNEECLKKEKLILRKRTRHNIIKSIEKTGRTSKEANKLFNKTNGLYWSMKNQLFVGKIGYNPSWKTDLNINITKAILLCGQWTENECDKLILKELSGIEYKEIIDQISSFMIGDIPLIIKINNVYKIADIEYAWEFFDNKINKSDWDTFLQSLYKVLSDEELIFSITPNQYLYNKSSKEYQSKWSQILKKGMLNSLIMGAVYKHHKNYQYSIDTTIQNIFNLIDSKEKWAYISLYMKELTEASPEVCLNKFESELLISTGMIEIFDTNFNENLLFGNNYFTNILWAIEQLLLQKQYTTRAINLLWKLNELNINYSTNNSPKYILENIFCAWINTCAISVDEKIELAKVAFSKYKKSWDIFYSLLPNKKLSIFGEFSEPKYRPIDEKSLLTSIDISKTYIEYFNLCINNIEDNSDKWINLIEEIDLYPKNTIVDCLNKVEKFILNKPDTEKYKLTNSLREKIYKHRFFLNSDWAMNENKIVLFENTLKKISFREPIYNYLYYFTSKYEMNLLNPIPYKDSDNSQDLNIKKQEELLKESFTMFKEKKFNLKTLIHLAQNCNNDNWSLGTNIAKYYDNNKYNEKTINIIIRYDILDTLLYYYIREIYNQNNNQNILKKCLNISRTKISENELTNILSIENIKNSKTALINIESKDIKEKYWQNYNRRFIGSNKNILLWALDECKKYGSLHSYIELLYDSLNELSIEQLFQYTQNLTSFSISSESLDNYLFSKILSKLYDNCKENLTKCNELAKLELTFSSLLDWDKMKFLKYSMKISPKLYAYIIKYIFKKDDGSSNIDVKKHYEKIKNYFDLYLKIKFCPIEFEGKVDYLEIKKWVLEFKNILIDQNQESLFGKLLGNLLPFAPTETETKIPCLAVRKIIEENFDKALLDSYIITEENKRGVYTPDAGESETELSKKYLEVANICDIPFSHTATIFRKLGEIYEARSEQERKDAENGYFYD